jgi:tetratricopeptide (TPR) repeat protein
MAVCFAVTTAVARQAPAEEQIQSLSAQGQQALARGDYQKAQALYEKLRKLSPGVAEIHANLGLIYFNERKFDLAIGSLRDALKLKPTLAKSALLLAVSWSELGKYQEALPGLEKGFRTSDDPNVRKMCGLQLERAYTGLGRDGQAVEVGLQLARVFPDDPEILYQNSRLFGNYAFLSVKRLADVAPNSIWKHQAAAEAWESQGSYDLAVSEYRQVLKMESERPGIHYRLGRALLARAKAGNSLEDSTVAFEEFAHELQIDPSNANAAYELAEAHRNSGDMEEAERFFRQALEYYPEFAQASLGLAAVLAKQSQPDKARPLIQRAIAENPEDEVAWYRLAQVERALGNPTAQQQAMSEFQRLRKKSSNLEAAKGLFSASDDVTRQKVDPEVAP